MTNNISIPQINKINIEAQLAQMSLEQKVGQVMMIGFDGLTLDNGLRQMIEQYHVGGVILFARNVESPDQVARLCNDLQAAALHSGHPGLFLAIDQEGGRVARLTQKAGFTEFPSAMALAAAGESTGSTQTAFDVAQAMAAEMRSVGLNVDFAPVMDVNNNPQNPVIGTRSFGSDPQQVGQYGVAFFLGLQNSGVMAFGKHFPGHGDTSVDSHIALPVVTHSRDRLEAVEFAPFRAAIQAQDAAGRGIAGFMSAHATYPSLDPENAATLSSKVLTVLLRQEMGYDGLLVTDSLEMGALATSGYPAPKAAAFSLQAGADLLLFNRDYALHQQAYVEVLQWVRDGRIPQSRLDEAARRVLLAKAQFDILSPKPVDVQAAVDLAGKAQHQALAKDVARRAITVLRDEADLLPIGDPQQVFVVEIPAAKGLGKLLNATAISISDDPSPAEISMVIGLGRQGRVLIAPVAVAADHPQQIKLVRILLDAHLPVVLIALRDPYDLMAFPDAPVMVATYGAQGPMLPALVDVLLGVVQPHGFLPVDLPGLFERGCGG